MDDQTSLSDQEESDLFDKIYQEIVTMQPWEFTKKAAVGSLSGVNATTPYASLPSDFLFFTANANYSDDYNQALGPVIFLVDANGTYSPIQIVSWSDRRQYLNQTGFAYVDIPNSRLVFTAPTPTQFLTYEFDYHSLMPALTTNQSPAWPAWHDIVYHYMCIDEYILEQSDKAKSYAAENKSRGDAFLAKMQYWNANLIQIN